MPSAISTLINLVLAGKNSAQSRGAVVAPSVPPTFRLETLADAKAHNQELIRLRDIALEAHATAASNWFAASVLFQGIVATAGQEIHLKHTLGRRPLGWLPINTSDNAFVAKLVDLPPGIRFADEIWLLPKYTCTTDLIIFG